MDLAEVVQVARGDEPADLVLRDAQLVNVLTGEIYRTNVVVAGGLVVALGLDYTAEQEIDLEGRYVCPGFIDAHVHLESSMVVPAQFARAVVPRGTTAVVTDPHEIANVCGLTGIRYMLDASEGLPLSVFVNVPSCVPATHMGTAGAELSADMIAPLRREPRVVGLAEMMNFPGLVLGDPDVLAKLEAFRGEVIDGHSPGVRGKWLNAYVAAGVGSDHECTTAEEAREKLRLGMRLMIREGTATKDLRALLPAVTPENSRRCCLCTDDTHPPFLLDNGHIDYLVRLAIDQGLDPVTAIQMATINAAEWFRLHDRGAIAPGRRADMLVFADLHDLRADMVFSGGRLVAQDGQPVGDWPQPEVDEGQVRGTAHVDLENLNLDIPAQSERARVIGVIEDQIVTEHLVELIKEEDGCAVSDVERDILKMAVIERHRGTGNVGLGFIKGLGLTYGAIASTVAHDHHNIVAVGADDGSMRTAVRALVEAGGGLVAANGDKVLGLLPLPIAGLMSNRPLEVVRKGMDKMIITATALGSKVHDPFMTMGFMALEVIPSLKLTDQGLVDVEEFDFVPLFVE